MKFALKCIWSLLIVPPLLFLKGDLSFQTMLELLDMQPEHMIEQKMESALGKKEVKELIIQVKVAEEGTDFTGEGLTINLYDKNYGYIQKSQIIKGQIRFRLVGENAKPESYILVSPETLDELTLSDSNPEKVLTLHSGKSAD
jgi:hypothetical protein